MHLLAIQVFEKRYSACINIHHITTFWLKVELQVLWEQAIHAPPQKPYNLIILQVLR